MATILGKAQFQVSRVSTEFASLDAAIAALGASSAVLTLVPGDTKTLTGNLTIPANVTLDPRMGVIATNGFTLTIEGEVPEVNYQVFDVSGGGSVVGLKNVNPRMFGGTDVASLQAAISALSAEGGRVRVPVGTYTLNDGSLLADSLERIVIEGEPGTRFIVQTGSSARPFIVRDCDRVEIRNIDFELDPSLRGGPSTYHGLDLQNVTHATVVDCGFYGFTNWGMSATENSATSTGVALDYLHVERCHFEDCGTFGMQHFPKAASRSVRYISNTFVDCGNSPLGTSDPVSFKAAQAAEEFIARDNIVIGGATAFGVMNWHRAVLEGNWVINADGFAFGVTVTPHQLYSAPFEYLVIRDNVCYWTDDFVPTTQYPAFDFNGDNVDVGPMIIEGNHVYGYGRPYRIRLAGATPNIRIRHNTFTDCLAAAICDDAAGALPSAPELTDNTFVNTHSDRTVDVRLAGDGARVERNQIVGYGERPIRIGASGGTAYVRGNTIRQPNPSGAATSRGAILVSGPGTYYVEGNDVDDPSSRISWVIEDSGATAIIERDNVARRQILVAQPAAPISGGTLSLGWRSAFGLREMFSNSAPGSGTFTPGDYLRNRTPSFGGAVGWTYTSGGWAPIQAGVLGSVSGTPAFVGQMAVVGGNAYIAVGISSPADWKQIT